MPQRDPLQQSMVDDFLKIVESSLLFSIALQLMPPLERQAVEDRYLELVWQMVLANADPMLGKHAPKPAEVFQRFGAFVNACKAGQPARFETSDFIALDWPQYDNLINPTTIPDVPEQKP
jgi:hypothetical protein